MDVQDGFILGIYNYCDRWCETCAFTSRCRVFADTVEMEAQRDPNLKPIADAPPLPQDVPPPPPQWMQELIDEMNKIASQPMPDDEYEKLRPEIAPEHEFIESSGARVHPIRCTPGSKLATVVPSISQPIRAR